MNNRIFELIQEQNGLGLVWSEEDKKYFAELIIEECIEVVSSHYHKIYESPAEDAIKEHFGVEE